MRYLLPILCLAVASCGPLTAPVVPRLSPEEQQQIDDSWQNMFTPPDRLERTLLLDVILTGQFHQRGVDRLTMISEKHVGYGLVVMEVRFDRADPSFDEFEIAYIDSKGYELRRERYTRQEIEERLDFLFPGASLHLIGDTEPCPEDHPGELTEEERKRLKAEREARFEEIMAATQPALEP